MAQALIQSNAQSALISTLNTVGSSLINPFEYSFSKRIPSHGVQWTKLQPVNSGHTKQGDTVNFDLIKAGFTRSLTLRLEVHKGLLLQKQAYEAPNSEANPATIGKKQLNERYVIPRTGLLNLIDHIDISSSTRRILTMSKQAILAAYSDLDGDARTSFEKGCRMSTGVGAIGTAECEGNADDPVVVHIPLLFSCFDNANLALATCFTEPIRVSVKFSSDWENWILSSEGTFVPAANDKVGSLEVNGASTVATLTNAQMTAFKIDKAELIVEQRVLPNELEDATVAANFSSGPLSQLVYDYETEVSQFTHEANKVFKHEIKSTSVITDIYVIVTRSGLQDETTALAALNQETPIKVKKVSFKASGQNLIDDMDPDYFSDFGRRTLKDGYFKGNRRLHSNTFVDVRAASGIYEGLGNPKDIVRLQMGLDNSKQYDSGSISLRELNAPTIEIEMHDYGVTDKDVPKQGNSVHEHDKTHNGKDLKLYVVLRKLGLQTTDSSSGRMVSTLSN